MSIDDYSGLGGEPAESSASSTNNNGDLVLQFTRTFNAPRDLVFRMWTEPEHLKHWYGPTGFEVVFVELDLRVGGKWRKCMRSPDGVDYWRSGVYREIARPERLAFTYVSDDPQGIKGHETLVTLDFLELGKQTLMVFRQAVFDSVATRNSHRGGWGQAIDRFGTLVESLAA